MAEEQKSIKKVTIQYNDNDVKELYPKEDGNELVLYYKEGASLVSHVACTRKTFAIVYIKFMEQVRHYLSLELINKLFKK